MNLERLASAARFVRDLAPWRWFVTLTFHEDVTNDHARWALRSWLRIIARHVVHDHLTVAWGFERTSRDRLHIHLLLHCADNARLFRPRLARAIWRSTSKSAGVTRFNRYRSEEHGAEYVIKEGDWDATIVCSRKPRCRRPRRGCVIARNTW